MPLPIKFDTNEIFIIVIGIILTLIAVKLLPNRFTYTTSIILYLHKIAVAIVVDHLLAGPPLDLYDVMDTSKFEFFDLIIYFFVYGPFTYIIIYIYDKWFYHKSLLKKFIYLLLITLINIGSEFIGTKLNIYMYKGWKLYYSIPVYLIVYSTNFYLLKYLKDYESNKGCPKGN
jgi:hypothetical protein